MFCVNFGWKCDLSFETQYVRSGSAAAKSDRNTMIHLSPSFPKWFLTYLLTSLLFQLQSGVWRHNDIDNWYTHVHLVVMSLLQNMARIVLLLANLQLQIHSLYPSLCTSHAFLFVLWLFMAHSWFWPAYRLGIKYCIFIPHCSYCSSPGRLLSSLCLSLIASSMELPDGITRRATGSPLI